MRQTPPIPRSSGVLLRRLACAITGLTGPLWPALRNAHGARVTSLSSRGHQRARVDFDDPQFQHLTYDRWHVYGQSEDRKTCCLLCNLIGVAKRVEFARSRSSCAVYTDFARNMTDDELRAWPFAPDFASNAGVRPYAIDPESAERIWFLSEDLTGVKFTGVKFEC